MTPTKECAYCHRIFPKNARFSAEQWDHSIYCSKRCAREGVYNKPFLSSLFARVEIDPITRCWLWQRSTDSKGYGLVCKDGKGNQKVHRVVYELAIGDIPDGMLVLHRCDNRPCCNPFHLFLGTDKDNSDDKVLKGRERRLRGEQVHNARLTEADVLAIRADHRTQNEIAKEYGLAQTTVSAIKRRVNWSYLQDGTP